jgi:hypothetical protein
MMWQDEARFFPLFARAARCEDLLDDPRFASPEARDRHMDALIEEVRRRFAARTRADWVARLSGSDCILGADQSPIDIPDDPQVRANGYIMSIQRADGTVFRAVGAPVLFDGEAPEARTPAEELGAETERVLREAGATDESSPAPARPRRSAELPMEGAVDVRVCPAAHPSRPPRESARALRARLQRARAVRDRRGRPFGFPELTAYGRDPRRLRS